MVLQTFGDFISQPSRAVLIFARVNTIQHEEKLVSILKRENRQPEFLAINPMGKLPAMIDDGFKLFESHAILRYLATTRSVPDHWYPADLKQRAVVDCILEWHHVNLRLGSSQFMQQKVLGNSFGVKPDEKVMQHSLNVLKTSLKFIEDVWLTGEGPFLAGARQPSIADLSLVCEIMQLELLDRLDREAILGPRETIRKWVQAVEEALAPHFADVHSLIRMVSAKSQAKRDALKRQSGL